MVIKKFQGNTETEAIMLAKEELGKDAIVMNIKTIKPKGLYKLFRKVSVEVTAALDDNNVNGTEKKLQVNREDSFNKFKETLKQNKNILVEENDNSDSRRDVSSETSAIEEKLNSLQSILVEQMKSHNIDVDSNQDKKMEHKNAECLRLIYNQLIENEVTDNYAKQIIVEIEKTVNDDTTVDNILSAVYQKIILKLGQPNKIEPVNGKVKFIYFIGPTGVGKTTTIAKIASKLQIDKKQKVALITSDTYRIAAVEQLRTYANILGIPVKVVYSKSEIIDAKNEFSDYDLVLVDTAGRSHKNKEQLDDLDSLLSGIEEDKEVYLVLSATTKYTDLVRIVESYKNITTFNIIFTKIDETTCVGNILNIRMLTNTHLSYATWGQNVPDDIGLINPQNIAKQLLGGK